MPDEYYESFTEITPEHLLSLGKKYIFSDIDNTLATYDDMLPPENVCDWIKSMEDNGIKVAFVSNNNAERVEKFNESLGCVAYSKAGKPLQGKLMKAVKDMGASIGESVLIGDQLLTDSAAGNIAGMHVIIVPPIKDVLTPFFKFKRKIEIPYINKFKNEHKGDN